MRVSVPEQQRPEQPTEPEPAGTHSLDVSPTGRIIATESYVKPAAADARGSRPSIAVLPFTEYDAPAADRFSFIGDAIAEDAIAMLTALPDLLVISRGSTQKYRGSELDIPAIGSELGVRQACLLLERRQDGDVVAVEFAAVRLGLVRRAGRLAAGRGGWAHRATCFP